MYKGCESLKGNGRYFAITRVWHCMEHYIVSWRIYFSICM